MSLHGLKIGFLKDILGKQEYKNLMSKIYSHGDTKEIDFSVLKFSDKQKQIIGLGSDTKTIAHGSKRSGKTYGIAVKIAMTIEKFRNDKLVGGGNAVFIVTGSTVEHARKVFLGTFNVVMEHLGLPERFNAGSSGTSIQWRGIDIYFFGLSRIDAYDKIQGITAFGWFATEVTKSLPENLRLCQDRVSYGDRIILWDCNPEHPMHYIYKKYIFPNKDKPIGIRLDTGCIHFNYKDSPVDKEYWESQKVRENWADLSEEEEDIIVKGSTINEEEKVVMQIIKKHKMQNPQLRDQYGQWMASDDMPLKNIKSYQYDLNAVKSAYSVAFLDVANTANERSCFSALAIAWRVTFKGGTEDIFLFTGNMWREPLVDVFSEIGQYLEYFNVNKFYYEENGAGALLGQIPEFKKFGGVGFYQKRNKVARILGDTYLDRICGLGILVEQKVVFAHDTCDPDFLSQVRNFQYIESRGKGMPHKVIGYCDAPDALASALYMLVYGEKEHDYNK